MKNEEQNKELCYLDILKNLGVGKHHDIKILPDFADAVYKGEKTFEVRENDRGYQKGDTVSFLVKSTNPYALFEKNHPLHGKTYKITYVLSGWGIKNGYVVFGIKPVGDEGEE